MASGTASGSAQDGFAAAHRALLADPRIQFDLPPVAPPPQTPGWLTQLFDWLSKAGPAMPYIFWAGVAIIVLLILRALWPVAVRLWQRWRGRAREDEAEGWRPEAAPARALLAEADALAARGEYGEAAHLVLLRSVEQIGARRPGSVRPALTSRDIARVDGLPGDVASAFALIAGIVETGLFAGRAVGAEAWGRARAAYEAVAFPRSWA